MFYLTVHGTHVKHPIHLLRMLFERTNLSTRNGTEHHFTGKYVLQFIKTKELHRREEETMFVTTC